MNDGILYSRRGLGYGGPRQRGRVRFGPRRTAVGGVWCLAVGLAIGLAAAIPSVAVAAEELPSGSYGSVSKHGNLSGKLKGEIPSAFLPDVGFSSGLRTGGDIGGKVALNLNVTTLGEEFNGCNAPYAYSSIPTMPLDGGALIVEASRTLNWKSPDGDVIGHFPSTGYVKNSTGSMGSMWNPNQGTTQATEMTQDAGSIVVHDAGAQLAPDHTGALSQSVIVVVLQDHAGAYTVYPFYRHEQRGFRNNRAFIVGNPVSCANWSQVRTATMTQMSGAVSIVWNTLVSSTPSGGFNATLHGSMLDGYGYCSDSEAIAAVNHLRGGTLDEYSAWIDLTIALPETGTGSELGTYTPEPSAVSTVGADGGGSASGWLARYYAIARGWLEPLYSIFLPLEIIGGWR